jgi:hypothetical protein
MQVILQGLGWALIQFLPKSTGSVRADRAARWVALALWGVLLCIPIGIGIFYGGRALIRANVVGRFDKDLQAYAALKVAPWPPVPPKGPTQWVDLGEMVISLDGARQPEQETIAGKVKGKIVLVDIAAGKMDALYFDLPDDLRASNPEEVATVGLLLWGKRNVPQPSDFVGAAFQQTCQVKVVDWKTKAEIATATFFGTTPYYSRNRNEFVTGSKPDSEVLTFLTGLHRQ